MTDESKAEEAVKKTEGQAVDLADSKTVHVKIYSPFKMYYEGEAVSISAESATGPFDILPGHHNFITLLRPCDVVVRMPNDEQIVKIDGGVMHVKANEIIVFLDV